MRGGRKRRDAIIAQLDAAGVQTRIGLMAAHIQPAYGEGRPSLPVTEALADETLALPLFHELGESDQDRVIESLRAAIR